MNKQTAIRNAIDMAERHVNNASSVVCLNDAKVMMNKDNIKSAFMWAKKSLCHSVGVFHEDYALVANLEQTYGRD